VLFPHQIALAATWNREISAMNGKITSYESRAASLPWNFNPNIDVAINPLWAEFPKVLVKILTLFQKWISLRKRFSRRKFEKFGKYCDLFKAFYWLWRRQKWKGQSKRDYS